MRSNPEMEQGLKEVLKKGLIVVRKENNPTLKCSYRGAGTLVSPKWNIKIYYSGSVVCTDTQILQDLLEDKMKLPDPSLKVVQIDDSGGGFPLLGVMIGINIVGDPKIWTDVVPVKFFQDPLYRTKAYLDVYTGLGKKLLDDMKIPPSTHRVEICSGYINKRLKIFLREQGFDVRVVEIKGLLQNRLESLYQEYVKKETGKDLGYDPKELSGRRLGMFYYSALNWGKAHAPHLIKSGWKAIKGKDSMWILYPHLDFK